MAEIEESERGDMGESRRWLMRANVADPDPAWLCDACGTAAEDWRAVCPKCGTFDALRWRAPAKVAALVAPAAAPARLAPGEGNTPSPTAS